MEDVKMWIGILCGLPTFWVIIALAAKAFIERGAVEDPRNKTGGR